MTDRQAAQTAPSTDGPRRVVLDPVHVRAVVLDMDGVVTDTRQTHFEAWRQLFDHELAVRPPRAGEDHSPFTDEDYSRHVDGRRREDGVAAFLAARGITLPWGSEEDGPGSQTVVGLGRRKNGYFLAELAAHGTTAYPSTVALVRALHAAGMGVGLVTASRNAIAVLDAAGVADLFPVLVDGTVAHELALPGKPDPATFLEASRRLHVEPGVAVVVEDAVSGVAAGRSGGFGLVIGVDRTGAPGPLRDAGADVVVEDLAQVSVAPGTAG